MMLLRFFTLLLFCFTVQAEEPPAPTPPPPQPKPAEVQIYTKEFAANVEALNKATEVLRDPVHALKPDKAEKPGGEKNLPLRDPTQMSGNFRQELKNKANPNSNAALNAGNVPQSPKLPMIELAGKIMGKDKTVMLKINERIVQIAENGQMAFIDKESQQLITIQVKKIDANQVKIFIKPLNDTLILQ